MAVSDRLTPQFWQLFLAAEFPQAKSRALLQGLGSFAGDPIDYLLRKAPLSEGERRRIDALAEIDVDGFILQGVRVLEEADYPPLLLEPESVPPALFTWGVPIGDEPTIAIVGTRAASAYGKAVAQKFAEVFARAGVTVVSGGALGIDAAAHKGALAAGGKTWAVLAGGVDNVYPAVHGPLFRQITQSGSLISQFALGGQPNAFKFLVRNQLVAALSLGVVVIEAPSRSGAIKTAEAASELGRQVFVVPADINRMSFHGSFNLIRDGATLVAYPEQVLEALGIAPVMFSAPVSAPSSAGGKILAALKGTSLPTELIVDQTGLDTGTVLSELTLLELEGKVMRDGARYALKP